MALDAMWNDTLDVRALAAQFALRKRLVIENIMVPGAAEQVGQVLRHRTEWSLAFNREGKSLTLSREAIANASKEAMAQLMQECLQNARNGFQYVYSCYPIVDAILAKRDLGHPLHDVLMALNAPEFRRFIEQVSGVEGLAKADGQATLFTRGNFLNFHNDFDATDNRRIAYVLGFTKAWRPDWGGILEFYDEAGNVECGFLPRFNVLTLFQVPVAHAVTFIPPYVTEGRYSITGWFSAA